MSRKKLKKSEIVNSVTLPFKDKEFQILFDNTDFTKIKEKLSKNKMNLDKEEMSISKNLSNDNFIQKAPEDLIAQNTSRLEAIKLELIKINSILLNI
jgi:valyl-tRNA synthetase